MSYPKQTLFSIILFLFASHHSTDCYSQSGDLNLTDLHDKVVHFNEHMQPDSVINIAIGLIKHTEELKEDPLFQSIIDHAVHSSLNNQDAELANKFITIIYDIDSYKNDKVKFGRFNLGIAERLANMHQYNESIHYCNVAFENFSSAKDVNGQIRVLLAMYNNAYFSQADSTNMSFLNQALEKAKEIKDSSLLSDVYFSAGMAYYRRNEHDKAITNYKIAKEFSPRNDLYRFLRISLYQHLDYTITDSVEAACELSEYILETALASGMEMYLDNAYLARAYCTAQNGLNDSTKQYLDLSEKWRSKTPKAKASPGYYDQMYRVSMIIKDYERALRYLETKADQENEINRKNKEYEFGDSRAKFDYLLQKAKIRELIAQNEIVNEKAKRRKVTIFGIFAILLVSIVAFLNARRQYKNLSHSYKSLVNKHLEVDNLNNRLISEKGKKDLKRNGFRIKDEEKILQRMISLLKTDRIFKDPDLSLVKLAAMLDTNTSYLSTIINKHFRMHFKSFINKHRIDEARKILISREGGNYSIEGIAREVGFQSRSVFYQTFRQITGLTPTAYIKTYKTVYTDNEEKGDDT